MPDMPSRPRDLTPQEQSASAGAAKAPARPTLEPSTASEAQAAAASEPSQVPPRVEGALPPTAAAKQAGAWFDSQTINALWSINEDKNSWVGILGTGWVKLANNSETGIIALSLLAAHAKQLGSPVSYGTDDTSGQLTQMYVW
jgi:hypothetical protein